MLHYTEHAFSIVYVDKISVSQDKCNCDLNIYSTFLAKLICKNKRQRNVHVFIL